MKRGFYIFAVLFALLGTTLLRAQETQKPTISVSSTGRVSAKPDLAVVFLNIKSTAPLAADALSQNSKKVEEAKSRLATLGYKDNKVKFSGNRFAPAGGGIFYGGQRPTGFDVYNFVLVYMDGPELKDVNLLNTAASNVLDELGKVGASPSETRISRVSLGGASVVAFTVKDPSAYEKEAYCGRHSSPNEGPNYGHRFCNFYGASPRPRAVPQSSGRPALPIFLLVHGRGSNSRKSDGSLFI